MTELTSRLRKLVASLDDARIRREEGIFMAEGSKCVLDTLPHFRLCYLFATRNWIDDNGGNLPAGVQEIIPVKRQDMERMTHLSTPADVIAIYEIPPQVEPGNPHGRLILALDHIQNPGNLGTIVRIADWFGIHEIICSRDTADIYNPKVVQATMGSIARVKVSYLDLPAALGGCGVPVYGTFIGGDSIYSAPLSEEGIIVMGNEGKGISEDVAHHVTSRLTIPSFPPGEPTGESLNVGMATAITVAEFRRRQLS